MLRKFSHWLALSLGLWLLCATARAEIDGPDMFVYVEVSVREITLEGMRQRLALLNSSGYTVEADNAVDAGTRVRIADIYAQFRTTAGAHVAYGTKHAQAIEAWLDQNPTWRSRYATLDSQFRSLSDQLSASRRAQ